MALLNRAGAPPRLRVHLVSRDEELDSLLARRRIAAHLGGLAAVGGACAAGPPPDAALVCDDEAATGRLVAAGVPVVHLYSGHRTAAGAPGAAAGALLRQHRPAWLPGPGPGPPGIRTTGLLAPARTARDRVRGGTLVLLSLYGVAQATARAFAEGVLPALVRTAGERTGRCEVVCDTGLALVRGALAGRCGPVPVLRAATVDVDELHAGRAVLLASPTLGALGLAQARRAPLAFLPPLGGAQEDLAARVRRVVPVPVAGGRDEAQVWQPPQEDPWRAPGPAAEDLRGAQRVARSVRQLALAPP
ncbi:MULTISPECIES: CGA synthase-related protein [Streptomyces]|uniref:CGA synthase-related protein n=1 Tax=Streptomyces luteosporeus TaxID=173856 RepID=A0ABN3TQQ3_9ACTN